MNLTQVNRHRDSLISFVLTMKFLAIGTLLLSTVGALATENIIQGARIIPANDQLELKKIGAHGHHKHPNRRTVIIRSSKSDTDDISRDFLWGIKAANHGGRLLLQKGKKYVIGKKLDLSFLDNIEVQLEGELKVYLSPLLWGRPLF